MGVTKTATWKANVAATVVCVLFVASVTLIGFVFAEFVH
jgi:hypothetical protein